MQELLREFERVFEEEYRKAMKTLKIGNPKEKLRAARRIARKRANRWLERRYGMRVEDVYAKLAPDVPIEELAV